MRPEQGGTGQTGSRLRPVLKEILVVGMAEKYVDIKIDAACGLEGLNHAEEALHAFESGEWSATESNDPEVGSEREDYESDVDLETALAKLRASASEELRKTPLDEVLAAADSTTSRKGDGEGEAFAAAVGAVAIGKASLPDAAERRDVETAAVAEALARYRQPEE